MDRSEIIDYLKGQQIITVPLIQKTFSLSYNQAKAMVDGLVEDDKLTFSSGITYKVREEKPSVTQRTIGSRPGSGERFSLAEYMNRRLAERAAEQSAEEEANGEDAASDNGDDEEPDAYDKLRKTLKEREEAESKPESKDESADDFTKMRARLGNLGKLYNIKRVFNDCVGQRIHSKSANNVYSNILSLDDGKQFELHYDDGIVQIVYDGFTPADSESARRADLIIEEYKSLRYKADKIVATVENSEDALAVLLELYAAVERINHRGE